MPNHISEDISAFITVLVTKYILGVQVFTRFHMQTEQKCKLKEDIREKKVFTFCKAEGGLRCGQ